MFLASSVQATRFSRFSSSMYLVLVSAEKTLGTAHSGDHSGHIEYQVITSHVVKLC